MAYAAVTCLRSTIRRLRDSSHISLISSTRMELELAYKEFGSLQKVLKSPGGSNSSSNCVIRLDGEIIGVAQKLEDLLELHELSSLSHSYGDAKLIEDIINSVKMVKKIKQEYNEALPKSLLHADADDEEEHDENDLAYNPIKEEEEAEDEEEESNMVGLSDQFQEIKQNLLLKKKTNYVFLLVGMAGIGKTALAKRIFDDSSISKRFECRAFVRVGQNYKLEDLKQAILGQLRFVEKYDDDDNDDDLKRYLENKRYLIVLDDVWDTGFWDDYFKDRRGDRAGKGSRLLLTTRIEMIAYNISMRATYFLMPLLNKEECWDLLRRNVFSDDACPSAFVNPGMKIAKKCEGLPLMVVTVARILLKAKRTVEKWNEATHPKHSSVFEEAYREILPVLYPSYNNLSPQERSCFLYTGAFPEGYEVRRSKLVNLWCIEGFLEPDEFTTLESFASDCFDKLNFDHVVVPAEHLSSDGQKYQACSLHSVFRYLCKRELESTEFLHIIDDVPEGGDGFKNNRRRRIAIYNAILLSFKEVYTSMGSSPTVRSLLCDGPCHKYQVPINFNMVLLRVLDALTVRFYEFPMEVVELVQLRYFAITCNKNLPTSISKLRKVEHLIVRQHLSILTSEDESYVPVEIWALLELRHLQLMGRNLPNPPTRGSALPQLAKLLDVGTASCTKPVLTSLPNLRKLRIQIQVRPNPVVVQSFTYLYNISQLHGLLKSLQYVIVNPSFTMNSDIVSVAAQQPSLRFPSSSITKLTLSGIGYPWEYMNTFVNLPKLQVLKLLSYAFRGEKWEGKGFLQLTSLLIEENDLVQWQAGEGAFPVLTHLTLKSCYKLKQLPRIPSLRQIELVDCNPNPGALSANQMGGVYITSSWDDDQSDSQKQNYISCIYHTTWFKRLLSDTVYNLV